MQVIISDKCKTLIAAAAKRWPEIYDYDEKTRDKLYARIQEWGSEVQDQIFAARYYLLDWAARKCGECSECSLHNNRLCGPVWSDGAPNARVFVISEGPGQYDQRTSIPFTSTQELNKSYCYLRCENFTHCFSRDSFTGLPLPECVKERKLVSAEVTQGRSGHPLPDINTAAVHLDKAIEGRFRRESWNNGEQQKIMSDLYITNIVKCRSIDKEGKDAEPKADACRSCWKWLELQLMIVQPTVVLLLGNPAGRFMFGLKQDDYKIGKFNGWFGAPPLGHGDKFPSSVKFVGSAFHPAYITRQYDFSQEAGDEAMKGIQSIFEKAHSAINGGLN